MLAEWELAWEATLPALDQAGGEPALGPASPPVTDWLSAADAEVAAPNARPREGFANGGAPAGDHDASDDRVWPPLAALSETPPAAAAVTEVVPVAEASVLFASNTAAEEARDVPPLSGPVLRTWRVVGSRGADEGDAAWANRAAVALQCAPSLVLAQPLAPILTPFLQGRRLLSREAAIALCRWACRARRSGAPSCASGECLCSRSHGLSLGVGDTVGINNGASGPGAHGLSLSASGTAGGASGLGVGGLSLSAGDTASTSGGSSGVGGGAGGGEGVGGGGGGAGGVGGVVGGGGMGDGGGGGGEVGDDVGVAFGIGASDVGVGGEGNAGGIGVGTKRGVGFGLGVGDDVGLAPGVPSVEFSATRVLLAAEADAETPAGTDAASAAAAATARDNGHAISRVDPAAAAAAAVAVGGAAAAATVRENGPAVSRVDPTAAAAAAAVAVGGVIAVTSFTSAAAAGGVLSILSAETRALRRYDLSIYLSLCLPTEISVYLSVFLAIDLSIFLSVCLSIGLSVYLSIYLSIDLPTYLSISIYLSIDLYVCMYVCMYVCIYLSID